MAQAGPPSPGGASQSNKGRTVVDASAVLRVRLDASLKSVAPTFWAFAPLNAIFGGDAELVRLLTTTHQQPHWDPRLLQEPLGGRQGQTLLHVAALFNRPEICSLFLQSLDAQADAQAEQQRLSVRLESAQNKTTASASERIASLGRELDKIERLFHMKCEAQLLTALSTADAAGRTTLHYAAASNGVMVGSLLSFRSARFKDAT